jgi:hypothetical protein
VPAELAYNGEASEAPLIQMQRDLLNHFKTSDALLAQKICLRTKSISVDISFITFLDISSEFAPSEFPNLQLISKI